MDKLIDRLKKEKKINRDFLSKIEVISLHELISLKITSIFDKIRERDLYLENLYSDLLSEVKKGIILGVVNYCSDKQEAANYLGITKRNLVEKLKTLESTTPPFGGFQSPYRSTVESLRKEIKTEKKIQEEYLSLFREGVAKFDRLRIILQEESEESKENQSLDLVKSLISSLGQE